MGTFYKSSLAAIVLLLLFTVPSLYAEWVENGIPVCTSDGSQSWQRLVLDGAGGAIFVWDDNRAGESGIYAQRVDMNGIPLWTIDGIAVSTPPGTAGYPELVSDGVGGAIVAWIDQRNVYYDVFAQRIDSLGNTLWTTDGVAVCTAAESQRELQMVSDGAGGAIITWMDERGPDYDIYAQRIAPDSTVLWTPDGVAICSVSTHQYVPAMVSDGAGGAIISWRDYRNGNDDVYAQRIGANGMVQWTEGGIAICTDAGDQDNPRMAADGYGGAIITWRDSRNVYQGDVYAQKIDANGNVAWNVDGIRVLQIPYMVGVNRPEIVSDGEGGAIITWEDFRFGFPLPYAQRIDSDGNHQWSLEGVPVIFGIYQVWGLQIASDGAGGAIATWLDFRRDWWEGELDDIYAQRIDSDGNVRWGEGGISVCSVDEEQDNPRIISDGIGGAFIAWTDDRNLNYDIFAQHIDGGGHYDYYYPAPSFSSIQDIPNDQGGRLNLIWLRSDADTLPNTEITYYSLWRLLPDVGLATVINDGGSGRDLIRGTLDFSGKTIRSMPLAQGYIWEWLENVPARHADTYALTVESRFDSTGSDPGWQYFVVTAHTEDPLIYYDSPVDSGYSVDNLAPEQMQGFAGLQSLAPEGLLLSWLPSNEDDLSYYTVHRGLDEFFVPDVSNRVGSTADTALIDTEWRATDYYFYKASAVDVHGNVGPYTLLRPEDIIVETLLQNFAASLVGDCVEISWTLSEAGENMAFFILRAEGTGAPFKELLSPEIESEGLAFFCIDRNVAPGKTYRYRIEVKDGEGRRLLFETDPIATPAMTLTLYQNHPNPFNPSTKIRYYLPEKTHVSLEIFDISGKRVALLVDENRSEGLHATDWSGRNKKGNTVTSGIYIYRLKAGKKVLTKKMVLLR